MLETSTVIVETTMLNATGMEGTVVAMTTTIGINTASLGTNTVSALTLTLKKRRDVKNPIGREMTTVMKETTMLDATGMEGTVVAMTSQSGTVTASLTVSALTLTLKNHPVRISGLLNIARG